MSRTVKGYFISFEGGEGSGKTTQIRKLFDAFTAAGRKCIVTREPGGSPSAEAIRKLLLTGSTDKWNAVAETLLFQAARVEHVENVIRPALARGEIVLCDRFVDSTIVYQGIGKGLGVEYIRELHRLTLGGLMPDVTLLFDIDPKEGLKRAGSRAGNETRFENMDIAFHRSVREGFLMLAKAEPQRFAIIDAGKSMEEVAQAVIKAAEGS
jgi:dTMP kinase